jgi:hypothetical protein
MSQQFANILEYLATLSMTFYLVGANETSPHFSGKFLICLVEYYQIIIVGWDWSFKPIDIGSEVEAM